MRRWQLLTLDELDGKDVHELAFAHCYDGTHCTPDTFWRPEYLYIPDGEAGGDCLGPYLYRVIPDFSGWYSEQKITMTQWSEVEHLALEKNVDDGRKEFFSAIRSWLARGNRNADCFWWFGI